MRAWLFRSHILMMSAAPNCAIPVPPGWPCKNQTALGSRSNPNDSSPANGADHGPIQSPWNRPAILSATAGHRSPPRRFSPVRTWSRIPRAIGEGMDLFTLLTSVLFPFLAHQRENVVLGVAKFHEPEIVGRHGSDERWLALEDHAPPRERLVSHVDIRHFEVENRCRVRQVRAFRHPKH